MDSIAWYFVVKPKSDDSLAPITQAKTQSHDINLSVYGFGKCV